MQLSWKMFVKWLYEQSEQLPSKHKLVHCNAYFLLSKQNPFLLRAKKQSLTQMAKSPAASSIFLNAFGVVLTRLSALWVIARSPKRNNSLMFTFGISGPTSECTHLKRSKWTQKENVWWKSRFLLTNELAASYGKLMHRAAFVPTTNDSA